MFVYSLVNSLVNTCSHTPLVRIHCQGSCSYTDGVRIQPWLRCSYTPLYTNTFPRKCIRTRCILNGRLVYTNKCILNGSPCIRTPAVYEHPRPGCIRTPLYTNTGVRIQPGRWCSYTDCVRKQPFGKQFGEQFSKQCSYTCS